MRITRRYIKNDKLRRKLKDELDLYVCIVSSGICEVNVSIVFSYLEDKVRLKVLENLEYFTQSKAYL